MAAPQAPQEPLPSELNTSSGNLAFLEVGKEKLSVRYTGPAQHDNDVGSIQANHPVPRRRLLYYFEVRVKEAAGGGSLTLGFSDRNFKQGRHPGYEPASYGYRGDTGRKHHSSLPPRGEEYGPAFGPGDVVGAGIHLTKHEIFFTKNGQHLGTAFRSVTGHPLFPTIGLHSQGACLEVNFGQEAFQWDPASLVQQEQALQAEALSSAPVSAGEVHQLVRGYLLHYGYSDSLAAFDEAAGMEQQDAAGMEAQVPEAATGMPAGQQAVAGVEGQQQGADGSGSTGGSSEAAALALLPLRAQLRQRLMAGDTSAAEQLLQQQSPGLLSGGGGDGSTAAAAVAAEAGGPSTSGSSGSSGACFEARFHLACQAYIEMIRCSDVAGALGFAEHRLAALRGASPAHDSLLREVVALIAYQQPEQSPLASLLSTAQREATADILNAALLRSAAPPGSPEPQAALELVLQQLTAVQRELHELAGGHGPEFDLQEHLPQGKQAQQQQQLLQRQQGGGGSGGSGGSEEGAAGAAVGEPVPMAE